MSKTTRRENERVVRRFGADILASPGMQRERQFMQHGSVSVYAHSLAVAVMCVAIARRLPLRFDTAALVRGALLHDYFLYDWHDPDPSHRLHAFHHGERAAKNAERDIGIGRIERNMIRAHMFPLVPIVPRYRESLVLCVADKLCAVRETFCRRR